MRIAVLAILMVSMCGVSHAAKAEMKTDKDKTLYAVGYLVGQGLDIFDFTAAEFEFVQQGIADSGRKKKAALDIDSYKPKIEKMAEERMAARAVTEKKKGKEFADKAAKEKNAVVLSSGIVIVEIKPGTGVMPLATDTVKVHYHGTFIDGKVFDSSVERGVPAVFPLDGVRPCWTEGLQKMKVGGKAKLVCPSNMAYGDHGRPPKISGGATLVFEVELLEIVKEEKPAEAVDVQPVKDDKAAKTDKKEKPAKK